MSEINVPFKNQLNARTLDGRPDENAHMNCLCSCIASGLQYYTRKEYEPDEVKDAVYGEAYKGGTAAIMDVGYCAKQGVRLYSVSGNTSYLVEQIHKHLALGHPVIGTITSSYSPPVNAFDPGPSHCIEFYKDAPGTLTAMNPWNAFAQCNIDKWWVDRLCYGSVWVMEKIEGNKVSIPLGWKPEKDKNGNIIKLVAPNGHFVVLGFLNHILSQPNFHPDNYPLEEEHGGVQLFRGFRLHWDAKSNVISEDYLGDQFVQLSNAFSKVQADAHSVSEQNAKLQAEYDQVVKVNEQLNAELDAKEQAPAPPSLPVVSLQSALSDPVPVVIPQPKSSDYVDHSDPQAELFKLFSDFLTAVENTYKH